MPVQHNDRGLVLAHPKGPSAEILFYGATVVSWKAPEERLFVSSKAALDGSKPVRGGIPVVFPCFGPPSHPEHARLGQHGFARNQVWTFDGVVADEASGVSVRLTLDPTPSIRAMYDRSFHLVYEVTPAEDRLSTQLQVTNTSATSLAFQALFHNYIRAPADQVLVTPLQNTRYYDKTDTTEQGRNTARTETRAGVDVRVYTDAVYADAAQKYKVAWPGGGVEIDATGLKDVVLWNPRAEVGGKMGDMEDGGWERYVCVEPGCVRGYESVLPGGTWTGRQELVALSTSRNVENV